MNDSKRRGTAPSQFVRRCLGRLPRGRALDVACGFGRHTLFLARHGFRVDAIDVSFPPLLALAEAAISAKLPVRPVQADLESFPLATDRYDVIVNVRYLQRSLWRPFKEALVEGGMLVFETFLTDQQAVGHPKNPEFLLRRGELAHAFRDFELLDYEEGLFQSRGERAYLARMLARRPRRRGVD